MIIEDDLVRHEGYLCRVYLDSEGYKTFGVGHLIGKNDPEYTWPVDTYVCDERVEQAFRQDFDEAVADAERLVKDLYEHPDNVVRVVVNMAFNLGYGRLSKFKRMLKAIDERKYAEASKEMKDSKWYGQVGRRSKELCRLMEWAEGEENV